MADGAIEKHTYTFIELDDTPESQETMNTLKQMVESIKGADKITGPFSLQTKDMDKLLLDQMQSLMKLGTLPASAQKKTYDLGDNRTITIERGPVNTPEDTAKLAQEAKKNLTEVALSGEQLLKRTGLSTESFKKLYKSYQEMKIGSASQDLLLELNQKKDDKLEELKTLKKKKKRSKKDNSKAESPETVEEQPCEMCLVCEYYHVFGSYPEKLLKAYDNSEKNIINSNNKPLERTIPTLASNPTKINTNAHIQAQIKVKTVTKKIRVRQ